MPSFGISQDSSSSEEVTTSEYETDQEPEEEDLLIMSTSQAPTTPVIRTQALPVDTKEIRINPPKPFDGNHNNLASFIQDIYVYLTLNRHIYDSQEKKIIFALSYLTEGTAKAWKEAFLGEILSQRPANFGTYEEFITRLQTAFSASDVEGEARA